MPSRATSTGPLRPGDLLSGRYRIEHVHESGSMGTIYAATQLSMSRRVAVKVLPPALRGDPDSADRFEAEAFALSRLSHPNVVRPVDYGLDLSRGVPYLVMEFVNGRALDELLRQEGALSPGRAVGLLLQVVRALTEAHRHGIVHRDLKPSNLIVKELSDGRELVKVLDFGVAQLAEALGGTICDNVVLGTPEYMSPEQAHGGEVDERADLYAVGCVLHTMLATRPPFLDPDPLMLLAQHLSEPPPPLQLDLEDGQGPLRSLDVLYGALMAKDREERPPNAQAVVREAEAILVELQRQRRMEDAPRGPRPTTDQLRQAVARETAPGPITEIAIDMPPSRLNGATGYGAPARGARAAGTSWRTALTYLALTLSLGLLWFVRTPSAIPVETPTVAELLRATEQPAAGGLAPTRASDRTGSAASDRERSDGDADVRLLRLQSHPSGAAVFDGDAQLGFTPLPVPLKPQERRTFSLLRPGYVPASITLNAEHPGDPLVTLIPMPRTAGR